jgi:Rieske Fe-S protein
VADSDDANAKPSRRRALEVLAVGGAVCAAAVGVPGVQMLVAPARGGAGGALWVKTVRIDSLADGVPKRVAIVADRVDAWTLEKSVQLGAVWLVRRGAAVECYSATCPHLGCSVAMTEGAFNCPCHDSGFTLDGKRTGGPSPRDMDVLETKLDDGFVVVGFRRFRQGVSDKVQIG